MFTWTLVQKGIIFLQFLNLRKSTVNCGVLLQLLKKELMFNWLNLSRTWRTFFQAFVPNSWILLSVWCNTRMSVLYLWLCLRSRLLWMYALKYLCLVLKVLQRFRSRKLLWGTLLLLRVQVLLSVFQICAVLGIKLCVHFIIWSLLMNEFR